MRTGTGRPLEDAQAVVDFWRQAKRHWFRKSPAFDQEFSERFIDLHFAAARGELGAWNLVPAGSLALMILLDQFPRNAFRGTAHMYATDPLARHYARQAEALGHMEQVEEALRLFFCLPFAHSEDLADQDLSIALHTRLGESLMFHAREHRDIIQRFGRFPHRNALLLRDTTAEEQAFLDAGGFAG